MRSIQVVDFVELYGATLVYEHIRRKALLLFLLVTLNRMRSDNVNMNCTGLHLTIKKTDRVWECVLKEKIIWPMVWEFLS